MILRKPYAFFIKHFKLLHLIMTIMIGYLIYRSILVLNFLNSYITEVPIVVGTELTSDLFHTLMFFLPFLIIVSSIVILSVMYVKKKPLFLYISNIGFYFILIILYTYLNNTIGKMELNILDIRIVRMARDILMMGLMAQCLTFLLTFIRATGFDLKKFDFGKDLKELEVKQEDNEEFEVDLEVDTNKAHRHLNYFTRHLKYWYLENKPFFIVGSIVIVISICYSVYMNLNILKKTYDLGTTFRTNDFTITVKEAYVTKKDYLLSPITEKGKTLAVLKIQVKKNGGNPKVFERARAALLLGKHKYYHTEIYRDSLIDLGKSYEDQLISNDEVEYLLVYKIPETYKNSKMTFSYEDQFSVTSGKLEPITTDIEFVCRDLDILKKDSDYTMEDEINFRGSILKESKLSFNRFEIAPMFTLNYQLCVTEEECYPSIEYVEPKLNSNTEKTLLRIGGTTSFEERVDGVGNLFQFIKTFGTLYYQIGDQEKYVKLSSQIRPIRVRSKDYFIEAPKEVEQAEKVWIVFSVRDFTYVYYLK